MNFENKVIVVTGASNGIGQAISQMYADKGGCVVLADIDEENGNKVLQDLIQKGRKALFIKTDVRQEEDIVSLMKTTVERYGKIDVLVNNAGKAVFKSPFDLTIEEWEDVVHTNLRSVFLCSREVAKYMKDNKDGGAIVNLASTRAFMSEPNSEAYAATKGGIIALTHALAASFSRERIRVNSISPGWIETGDYSQLREIDHEQHFSRRVGIPDDIARTCLFLTWDETDFITGENLVVDGGMTKKMIYVE